jgi:hypothetical protein
VRCKRDGSGPDPAAPYAKHTNVAHGYDIDEDDESALGCARSIADFILDDLAPNEMDFSATAPQVLRSSLLTGTASLSKPYEVFLDNIYITTSAVATLSLTSAPAAKGLGSCRFNDYMLLIECADDEAGSVVLRDDYGIPLKDWAGNPLPPLNLNGLLSQWGGTAYGNLFLVNQGKVGSYDDFVLHHEQVHSQQWSQYGWSFGQMYLQSLFDSPGNALYNFFTYGPTQNVFVPPRCYILWERRAGFQDGNYAFRDADHALPSAGSHAVASNKAYPTNWTTANNDAVGGMCPATWK